MFLDQMSTDEAPATPDKVIAMLKRKVGRRLDKRRVTEWVGQLQTAIRSRNIELGRVRQNYERLEVAFMRQHLRDAMEIEHLKQELSLFKEDSEE